MLYPPPPHSLSTFCFILSALWRSCCPHLYWANYVCNFQINSLYFQSLLERLRAFVHSHISPNCECVLYCPANELSQMLYLVWRLGAVIGIKAELKTNPAIGCGHVLFYRWKESPSTLFLRKCFSLSHCYNCLLFNPLLQETD